MSTQSALYGTDYSQNTITIDTTDIDKYTDEICHFPKPTTSSGSTGSPTAAQIIEGGAAFVLANIEQIGQEAIDGIVGAANTVANAFEDGFNVVVQGLIQFGDDLEAGFL
jgi:hypothetical protein